MSKKNRKAKVADLSPKSKKITSKEAAAVRGGKGVRDKEKYMVVKLKEAFVTS